MKPSDLAALRDEPACDHNLKAKSGCARPKPGASAGGCAFDGAQIALLPIADVAHIVHGPIECAGSSWDNRGARSTGPALYRLGMTTDLNEQDVIMGRGEKRLFHAVKQAVDRYQPAAVFVYSTCVTALIGDDLNAFITNAKHDGRVPMDFPTPFAHTPSFVGSHTTGWDNMLEGILSYFTLKTMEGKVVGSNGKLNLVLGFDGYLGNLRVIKRMLKEMGVEYTFLSDPEEVLDTPADGEFRMYAGGTTQDELKDAPNAIDTLLLQPWHLTKTKKFVQDTWKQPVSSIEIPMGLAWTDAFLMKVSELTGKPIPESLEKERGRLVDMMADSHQWLHGKKYSVFGDPDFVTGMCQVLLELGAEPLHVLCQNGSKKWAKDITKMLKDSPYGQEAEVHMGKDLWHLRSLVFSKKPDYLIGNSYGKFIQRDTLHKGKEHEVPLIRLGFPLFDRHHLHRDTTLGYEGTMYILKTLVNAVMERFDQETMILGETDYAFDLVR